ncbi:MAG: RloB domain-containing protein, partial [Candidatus Riflebacteria bacterium]|nr:RloB domain-containing protein [Candidatus Riflebacteria bacterium]
MRTFCRPYGQRRYNRLFLIAAEGSETEPGYFSLFDGKVVRVECLSESGKSAPVHVLKRMNAMIDRMSMRAGDEAWLVVDKDHWSDEQLNELWQWSQMQQMQGQHTIKRGLAVSNPKFEYWLLLHFEDGSSPQSCSTRLRFHIPGYDKTISSS